MEHNIFDILKEKNISQKEFSEKTGIQESSISKWKTERNPTYENIKKILETYPDINANEIFGCYGDKNNLTYQQYQLLNESKKLDEKNMELLILQAKILQQYQNKNN